MAITLHETVAAGTEDTDLEAEAARVVLEIQAALEALAKVVLP